MCPVPKSSWSATANQTVPLEPGAQFGPGLFIYEVNMQLEMLQIHRATWKSEAPLEGQVKFKGINGHEISLQLTDEQCKRMVVIVGEALVETAKQLNRDLVKGVENIIGESHRLEGPTTTTEF